MKRLAEFWNGGDGFALGSVDAAARPVEALAKPPASAAILRRASFRRIFSL
jgi:hypothetical protein